jgi:hypothetical protein
MQSNRRRFGQARGRDHNVADRAVPVAVLAFEEDGVSPCIHVAEQVISVFVGQCIQSIRLIKCFDQRGGTFRQYLTLQFCGHVVIEYHQFRFQQEGSVPEKNRFVQVKIQPQFELVVGDDRNILSAHIDIEIRMRTKYFQWIMGDAVREDRIVIAQRNPDLEDLAIGGNTRSQQRVRSIAQSQEVIQAGRNGQGVPDNRTVIPVAAPAPEIISPKIVLVRIVLMLAKATGPSITTTETLAFPGGIDALEEALLSFLQPKNKMKSARLLKMASHFVKVFIFIFLDFGG